MVHTPSASVKADVGALNVGFSAAQHLARGVEDIGTVIGEVGQQIQHAKNLGIMAEADTTMRQATADFHTSLQGNADEDHWEEQWKERAQSVREQIASKYQLGSDMKKQMNRALNTWSQTNQFEVRGLARKQQINRVSDRVTNNLDEVAKGGGDERQVDAILSEGLKAGIFMPEEAQHLKKQTLNKTDVYAANNYIDANPLGAVAFMTEKDLNGNYNNLTRLDPHQRDEYIRRAKAEEAKAQGTYLDAFVGRTYDGNPASKEEIQNAMNQNQISAKGAFELKRIGTTQAKAESRDTYNALRASLIDTDFESMTDDERNAFRLSIKDNSATLEQGDRNTVLAEVDRKIKAVRKSEDTAQNVIKRSAIKDLKEDYATGKMLPSVPEMEEGKNWWSSKVATGKLIPEKEGQSLREWQVRHNADKATIAENQKHYDQAVIKLDQFMKDNPKATQDEVDAYREKLTTPWVLDKIKKQLAPETKPTDAKEPTKEKPPVGAKFYSKSTQKWYDADKNEIK